MVFVKFTKNKIDGDFGKLLVLFEREENKYLLVV